MVKHFCLYLKNLGGYTMHGAPKLKHTYDYWSLTLLPSLGCGQFACRTVFCSFCIAGDWYSHLCWVQLLWFRDVLAVSSANYSNWYNTQLVVSWYRKGLCLGFLKEQIIFLVYFVSFYFLKNNVLILWNKIQLGLFFRSDACWLSSS